ncbi:hypothetical protein O3M35_001975 [Rhynocoris fuscipes]|uniref:Uncharacterized protein n=1 Tax=Rhynocoris fuscipes TaxID=488301 RepID=A0AAW1CQU0_9HEMI
MSQITRLFRIGLRNSFAISRRYKATDQCEPSSSWKRLKRIQEKYSEETGCPIHLISGTKDKLLFRTTMLLSIIGLIMSLFQLTKYFILPQ